ncbi:hypothetical protein V8C37DRAFT_403013 [Trichoderma ceciliae]
MLRRKHSRSVSWDDQVQVIYFPKAEPVSPAPGYPLYGHYFLNAEADAENMTPSEFDYYRRRMWYIEKIRVLLRDICFDKAIVDRLPEKKIKGMDTSFAPLYDAFKMDAQIIKAIPGL